MCVYLYMYMYMYHITVPYLRSQWPIVPDCFQWTMGYLGAERHIVLG